MSRVCRCMKCCMPSLEVTPYSTENSSVCILFVLLATAGLCLFKCKFFVSFSNHLYFYSFHQMWSVTNRPLLLSLRCAFIYVPRSLRKVSRSCLMWISQKWSVSIENIWSHSCSVPSHLPVTMMMKSWGASCCLLQRESDMMWYQDEHEQLQCSSCYWPLDGAERSCHVLEHRRSN